MPRTLANCNGLSLEVKEPILLTQNQLANLILEDCHKRTLHSGTRATLIHLRTQFSTPRGSCFTQKILRNCNTCRLIGSKSYRYPDKPALPSYRKILAPTFSAVGIGYTGKSFSNPTTQNNPKPTMQFSPAASRVQDTWNL